FHVFCKTCGSLLNEAGRNPVQVQGWLGHHAASFMLDTYVRRMDDGLGDADALDNLWGHHGAAEGPQTTKNRHAANPRNGLVAGRMPKGRKPPQALGGSHNPSVPGSNPG